MLYGRRRLAVGVVVFAIAAVGSVLGVSAAAADRGHVVGATARAATPVAAAIRADGTSVGVDPAWFVHKPSEGRYVLTFGTDVDVEIQSWDAPATVTMRSSSSGTWIVDFVAGDHGVDTGFTFSAVPLRP